MNAELVLGFLEELALNNNREWFHAHHDFYTAAKREVEQLIRELEPAMWSLDPDLNGYTEPKIALFRLFRDIRFSADKIPYKEHFGIFFSKGGRKVHYPGYYIHIQPHNSILCGGVWLPEPDKLKAIRQEIIYNTDEFLHLLEAADFRQYYNGLDHDYLLTRVPNGYPKDFPYPEFLRTKSFTFSTPISDEEMASEQFPKKIIDCFLAVRPVIQFLKRAMDEN